MFLYTNFWLLQRYDIFLIYLQKGMLFLKNCRLASPNRCSRHKVIPIEKKTLLKWGIPSVREFVCL